jgi:hypothetical protein
MYDGLSYPCLSIFPQMLGLILIPTVNITERQLQRMMLAGLRGAAEWGVKRWCHRGAIGGAWRVIDLRDGLSHSSSSFAEDLKISGPFYSTVVVSILPLGKMDNGEFPLILG